MENKKCTKYTRRLGNNKPIVREQGSFRARNWAITMNNYPKDIFVHFTRMFQHDVNTKWIFGKEIGKQGTPHVQGFVSWKSGVWDTRMRKLFPKCNVEPCKKAAVNNYLYCVKDDHFITNIDARTKKQKEDAEMRLWKETLLKEDYTDVTWKPWQKQVLEILDGPVDKRHLYWFWEPVGNVGKSYLVTYISLTREVICASGKATDVFNQVNNTINIEKKRDCRTVIVDCPRSAADYLSYGALEKLKDGFLYSGKYEGGKCWLRKPHVIVFANTPPKAYKMSKDRWIITHIGEQSITTPSAPKGGRGAEGVFKFE